MRLTSRVLGLLAAAGPFVLGCTDSTGLGKPAPISVTLQRASSIGAPSFQLMGPAGATALVNLADVDSLNARVVRVDALPVAHQADSTDAAAWQTVDVVGSGLVNLVKLPTLGGILVATDSVPSGNYGNLRFFLEDMTIWFNKQIPVGQILFQPNTPYTVTLPSGAQTGLKTKATFVIPEDGGTVNILFDGSATLADLSVTGSGTLNVVPVLRQM